MDILEKALKSHSLDKAEIVELLRLKDAAPLYAAADAVRQKYVGEEVHLRGLIEFSNICKQNCLYCGLRRDNKKVKCYRLSADEIIKLAANAKTYGYNTVVLQSGEDSFYDVDKMTHIIKKIKALDLALTLSIGEKTFEEYRLYREAGADRYLLRIETTDKALYERLDPGMSFENRLRCLKDLKELGYEVGSGIMAGLPGQSEESIAEDILFMKNLPVHMAGIGPFIANPDTPLAKEDKNNFDIALRTMAVTRLLMPLINIPATTAMEALDKDGRLKALQSGANVVMPNVTEGEARKLYILYPGKICTGETPSVCRGCIENKIKAAGRRIGLGKGVSKAYVHNNNEEPL
ncbi:MAG: [FeFe] hydrogenase H-cluster radical SAM maturase HydE [Elusimicrobia bacterium]|nr:[FeFe] hydrogenase H-cluster radical SAM maturase HydE [Elusimicrobiota bacterium]